MTIPESATLALYVDGANVGTIDLRQMAAHIIRQAVATLEAQGRLLPGQPPCVVCGLPFVRSRKDKTICDNAACQNAKATEYKQAYRDKKADEAAAVVAAAAPPPCPDCGQDQTFSRNRQAFWCRACHYKRNGAKRAAQLTKAAAIVRAPAKTPAIDSTIAVQPPAVSPCPIAPAPDLPDASAPFADVKNRVLRGLLRAGIESPVFGTRESFAVIIQRGKPHLISMVRVTPADELLGTAHKTNNGWAWEPTEVIA